ncbi:MAG TPA: response regulator [Syntrophomonadaceae bacterium]|nr:response regulator [Syntrophomonadaceae bacterium]
MNSKDGKRVLIVEDSILLQHILQTIIYKIGLQFDMVENGEDAIKLFQQKYYDLILMDCQLPGISGYEATRIIRETERDNKKQVPIIGITTRTMENHAECLAAGMNDYLGKPFHQLELQQRIQRWLGMTGLNDLHQDTRKKLDLSSHTTAKQELIKDGLDLHRLEELTNNDPEIMAIIIRDYQDKSLERMTQLIQASQEGRTEDIRQIAHLFLPLNDYIGAHTMVRLLKSIESAAQDKNLNSIRESIDELTREHAQVLNIVSKK